MFLVWPVHFISPSPCDGIMVYVLIDNLLHCNITFSAAWLYETVPEYKGVIFQDKDSIALVVIGIIRCVKTCDILFQEVKCSEYSNI